MHIQNAFIWIMAEPGIQTDGSGVRQLIVLKEVKVYLNNSATI
jgi:hypothetical protein